MEQLVGLTRDAKQKTSFLTNDNVSIKLELIYVDNQQCWLYNITSDIITIKGSRLTTSPNILMRYYKNIPFGIAVVSSDGHDPAFIQDFENERIRLFVLTEEEVSEIQEAFFGS